MREPSTRDVAGGEFTSFADMHRPSTYAAAASCRGRPARAPACAQRPSAAASGAFPYPIHQGRPKGALPFSAWFTRTRQRVVRADRPRSPAAQTSSDSSRWRGCGTRCRHEVNEERPEATKSLRPARQREDACGSRSRAAPRPATSPSNSHVRANSRCASARRYRAPSPTVTSRAHCTTAMATNSRA